MSRGNWLMCVLVGASVLASRCPAGDNEATYQGCLMIDGAPANGVYDLRFTLYDAATGGTAIGIPDVICGVEVVDCKFTVILNSDDEFTAEFISEKQFWLEIEVADAGDCTSYLRLAPRQKVVPPPWSRGASVVRSTVLYSPQLPIQVSHREPLFGVGLVELLDSMNQSSAFVTRTHGGGDALEAEAMGIGSAVRGIASGTGRAGFFEVLNASSTADALEATTAGSGRGVRAVSVSGIGLLAESSSGTGLKAISTTGAALDVAGRSVFSGTAAFNHATPFTVASAALVPNLNASFLGGGDSAFYRDASNLNAGTLASGRLSGVYSGAVAFSNVSNTFPVRSRAAARA